MTKFGLLKEMGELIVIIFCNFLFFGLQKKESVKLALISGKYGILDVKISPEHKHQPGENKKAARASRARSFFIFCWFCLFSGLILASIFPYFPEISANTDLVITLHR